MLTPLRLTFGVLALMACEGSPNLVTKAPTEPTPPIVSAPGAPQMPKSTPAQRRARFDARPNVEAPAELHRRWREALKALPGSKIESLRVAARVGSPSWQRTHLRLRSFGLDATLEGQIKDGLRAAKLQAEGPIPEEPVQKGNEAWSVEVGHLVAPKGEARGHRVELDWQRTPKGEAPPCRKPSALDAPKSTPSWLKRVVRKGANRRLVGYDLSRSPKAHTTELLVWFHNGYAQDHAVAALTKAVKAAGLAHTEGEGPRQTWQKGGRELSWRPINEDLHLGCTPTGPVIELLWVEIQSSK